MIRIYPYHSLLFKLSQNQQFCLGVVFISIDCALADDLLPSSPVRRHISKRGAILHRILST